MFFTCRNVQNAALSSTVEDTVAKVDSSKILADLPVRSMATLRPLGGLMNTSVFVNPDSGGWDSDLRLDGVRGSVIEQQVQQQPSEELLWMAIDYIKQYAPYIRKHLLGISCEEPVVASLIAEPATSTAQMRFNPAPPPPPPPSPPPLPPERSAFFKAPLNRPAPIGKKPAAKNPNIISRPDEMVTSLYENVLQSLQHHHHKQQHNLLLNATGGKNNCSESAIFYGGILKNAKHKAPLQQRNVRNVTFKSVGGPLENKITNTASVSPRMISHKGTDDLSDIPVGLARSRAAIFEKIVKMEASEMFPSTFPPQPMSSLKEDGSERPEQALLRDVVAVAFSSQESVLTDRSSPSQTWMSADNYEYCMEFANQRIVSPPRLLVDADEDGAEEGDAEDGSGSKSLTEEDPIYWALEERPLVEKRVAVQDFGWVEDGLARNNDFWSSTDGSTTTGSSMMKKAFPSNSLNVPRLLRHVFRAIVRCRSAAEQADDQDSCLSDDLLNRSDLRLFDLPSSDFTSLPSDKPPSQKRSASDCKSAKDSFLIDMDDALSLLDIKARKCNLVSSYVHSLPARSSLTKLPLHASSDSCFSSCAHSKCSSDSCSDCRSPQSSTDVTITSSSETNDTTNSSSAISGSLESVSSDLLSSGNDFFSIPGHYRLARLLPARKCWVASDGSSSESFDVRTLGAQRELIAFVRLVFFFLKQSVYWWYSYFNSIFHNVFFQDESSGLGGTASPGPHDLSAGSPEVFSGDLSRSEEPGSPTLVNDGKHSLLQFAMHHFRQSQDK